jgi:5-methylcytosine-specific restriction enzyme A
MSSDRRSPEALAYRRWYSTAAWRRLRVAQLLNQRWCRLCAEMDRWTRATVVDHRQPHRGSSALFFDPGNLDSLCKTHHNGTKQRLERGRRQVRIGADGWPVGT